MSFFNELKRRKVFRVGIGYVLIAWLLAQVLQLLFESFGTPDWMIKTVLALLAAGFPMALFLAWAYELTPEGLKRERDVEGSRPITADTIRKLRSTRSTGTKLRSAIYKSRCNGIADWDLVESVLESSTKNNPANAITGVLLATETHFLQLLEGEFEALNATLERISRDTRHCDVQLISFSEIEERRFGNWGMHGIGLFDLNPELVARLGSKFGVDDGSIRFPSTEHEVIDLLSMVLPEDYPG